MSKLQTLQGHTDCVISIAFSPGDGAVLASGSWDTIILWNAKNHFQKMQTLQGHSNWVRSVAFSPGDGAVLASGSDDNKIILWDAKNHFQKMQTLQGHSSYVDSVVFSPGDGAVLASGSNDGTIILWNAKNHFQKMQTLKGHSNLVRSVAFSPGDGAVLASGSSDKTIILWDAKNHFQQMQTLQGHSDSVWSVAFSPGDGAVLASGSNDGTIILWDAKNHFQKMQTLQGHSSSVWSVAFSPGDGAVLASGSSDKTIILWDAKNHFQQMQTLQGHSSSVYSVAFSPGDGAVLASGSGDKTIILWDVSQYTTPPIPEFFTVLEEAQQKKWSSWKTLEVLAQKVTNPTELQLYYTATAAAYKLGDITKEERDTYIINVLNIVPDTFKFDQSAEVVAKVKLVLEKARADGILSSHTALRLDQLVENAHTFADARFTGLVEHLAKLQLEFVCLQDEFGYIKYRIDRVETRLAHVEGRIDGIEDRVQKIQAYVENTQASLVKFKKQVRKHFKRKAAASTVSAFLSTMTLGMGSGIANAVSAVCDSVFSKVIDFSDTKHVLEVIHGEKHTPTGSDLAAAFTEDKIQSWIDKPLTDVVREPDLYPEFMRNPDFIQIASLLQISVHIDAENSSIASDALSLDDTLPPPPPVAPKNLGDEAETFAKLKEFLDLGEDVKEIPVDDDFMDAFQGLFDISFNKLGPNTEKTCRCLVDSRNRGTIRLLHWRVFYKAWLKVVSPWTFTLNLKAPKHQLLLS